MDGFFAGAGVFSRAYNAEGYAEALELCQKALAEDPGFIQARGLLAATLFNLGRDEEALGAAKEALRQQPDKSTAARLYLLTANILLMQQQVPAEQQAVAEGLRLCPDLADLLALRAGLHERVRDFDAAAACLRRAIESDPGNPRLYAWLGQVQAKQGSLTNALASLEYARQLLADIPAEGSDDIELSNIELALAEAYASVGNLAEALQHYRRVLAEAREAGLGEARVKWVEETVRELERRSEPVPVAAEKPRQFLPGELQTALRERLTAEEVASAVNSLAATPEMVRWARELVAGAESDLVRARKLFDTLAARPKAAGAGTRTAQEVFAAWNDLDRVFVCQEYAKLFVALARSADLPAFYVHVERDYSGRVVDHDCAVVFAEGKAWLVDPTYAWFGVPHREFRVLDDLQTIAHHAFQPHGGGLDAARCRAGCKLDPDFAWGRINLVLALIQTNKLGEARTELDLVRRSAPDYWRGLAAEGFLAFKQERFDRAVEWLQRAVKANPDHADARLLLGEALFRTGQRAAAREELLAGLRRSFRPGSNNELLGRKTLALLEEALGADSNKVRTAKSRRDAAAYHDLGVSFLSRPSPDYASAAKWFRKAAELGDPQAELVLGMLYWTGRGVPRDPVRAVYWWRKLAEGGDPVAMRNLGLAYSRGVGVERNLGEALNWLRRAAEGGDPEAQAAVGKACYEGRVVPKNLAEALAWLTLATAADAKSPGVKIEDSESSSVLRQARHLLREIELFASPEEKAAAKAKVEKFRASRPAQSLGESRR